jgi:hypothetical protein
MFRPHAECAIEMPVPKISEPCAKPLADVSRRAVRAANMDRG